MSSYLYLDIETLPADLSRDEIRALAADSVPGNYKDPAKIDAWIAENAADRHHRTALDPMAGRVLMLAFAVDDGPVVDVYHDDPNDPTPALDALHGALVSMRGTVFVGHNIAGFDLPYLRYAALRCRHPVARMLPAARYSHGVEDTMALWAGTIPRPDHTSLARIAAFLGLEGKASGMDGSQVYPAWLAGRHDEIRAYGRQDVELVRDVHSLLIGDFNPTTPEVF